ncbi:MAG: hypothetical protein NTX53_09760 [candidate division WOR-3 bacterium]|nr:hypothetical protein [candidate division WOR-3 bacterium]
MVIHRNAGTRVACVMLAAASIALASPSIRLGGRGTTWNGTTYIATFDSLGEVTRTTYEDAYKGMGIEALYGPIGWVYGRAELASVRFFNAGGGALFVFPTAGLDVLVEPQFHWRLLPYVWGGAYYMGYWGNQGTADPRFLPPDVKKINSLYGLRVGIGLEYRLSKRVDISAEIQTLDYLSALNPSGIRGFPQQWWMNAFGLLRADIGFRYDFGAR